MKPHRAPHAWPPAFLTHEVQAEPLPAQRDAHAVPPPPAMQLQQPPDGLGPGPGLGPGRGDGPGRGPEPLHLVGAYTPSTYVLPGPKFPEPP